MYGDISIKDSSNRTILPEPESYYLHVCASQKKEGNAGDITLRG